MRSLLGTVVFLFAALCVHAADIGLANTLTPKENEDGWVLLFDGKTTFGWKTEGDAKVNDGGLGPISLQGHDPTTDLSYRNIRIAEFRMEPGISQPKGGK
jgi:hypothetical protein